MKAMPLLLVALASLSLAGCEDKTKPTPDKPAAASPAPTQSANAAPAAKPAAAPAEGGW
ncbi:hypothetical protein [Polyangium aurulentum]|uniref:hypothetical protein n=1 Tax=Polyangium aurulentum TaxID=2567896 RepID=UPI00146F7F60|nr:hypothetical protein [Polyangium aurulentum]UQA54740.1 hypothetical protein E8A73_025555 [Polyangium aurulentum]